MKSKWSSVAAMRRILGREQGSIVKDWGGKLAVALVYPNRYHVAMSSLGFQSIYAGLNRFSDVVCERVFHGVPGLSSHEARRLSLESQRPVEDFTVVAFSLSFELDYLNAVDMIRALGIPLSSSQRDDSSPLIIAGGPAITANPLPLSSILDAVVIGESEMVLNELVRVLTETAPSGRNACLRALADIPGVYVPLVHGPTSECSDLAAVQRQWLHDLDGYPTHSTVLSPDTEFSDMFLIEIARGCARSCPFCLAGHTYRPHRERQLGGILSQAREGLQYRQRIGLVSAAVSDYSEIDALASELRSMGARLAVSSLRVRPISDTLVRALSESGNQTLTIAPEAGSRRLRKLIQKGVSEEDLLHAAELAQKYDFRQLKLYFMVGLPTETDEDVLEIVRLADLLGDHFSRQIIVNATPFVPKAHTPFERAAMRPKPVLQARLALLRKLLAKRGVTVKYDSPKAAVAQGILARGDRDVSLLLENLAGPTIRDWQEAVQVARLDPHRYLDERLPDECLPWRRVVTV